MYGLRVSAKWLRRQITPGLLRHHVGGVPGWPGLVLARPVKKVRPSRALLALDMGGLGTPQRVFQVFGGRERNLRGVDPSWVPSGDLLHEPQVAVGIVNEQKDP
jgi:hypothetical protein